MTTRICFIRHGETDWNVTRRIQGQTDIPLNETGFGQALAMAFNATHYKFSAIYSSDLSRASVTAKMVAERQELEVRTQPNLRERHYGILQGITVNEMVKNYPDVYAHYKARDLEYDFETGESLLRFAARISVVIDDLTRLHSGQSIAAISHAGVLDIVYRKATGRLLNTPRDFVIPNCALNWFRFDGQGWHLEAWNAHNYLDKVLMKSVK